MFQELNIILAIRPLLIFIDILFLSAPAFIFAAASFSHYIQIFICANSSSYVAIKQNFTHRISIFEMAVLMQ